MAVVGVSRFTSRTLNEGVSVLVTVTPRLRIHRDEVLCAIVRGNSVVLRFVSMKPIRVSVDDLTDEARYWLLPSLAPREIPTGCDCGSDDRDRDELVEEEVEEDAGRLDEAR
jgi:hypothetical protein